MAFVIANVNCIFRHQSTWGHIEPKQDITLRNTSFRQRQTASGEPQIKYKTIAQLEKQSPQVGDYHRQIGL